MIDRAAVQICSLIVRPCRLDIGQQGRILIHLALHPWRNAGLTLQGQFKCCRFLRQTKQAAPEYIAQ